MHDITLRVHKDRLDETERNRTVWLLYKPYHWVLDDDGYLSLKPDWSEHEKIRRDIFQMLLDKGVPEHQISKQMIEDVVDRATDYLIAEANDSKTEAGA